MLHTIPNISRHTRIKKNRTPSHCQLLQTEGRPYITSGEIPGSKCSPTLCQLDGLMNVSQDASANTVIKYGKPKENPWDIFVPEIIEGIIIYNFCSLRILNSTQTSPAQLSKLPAWNVCHISSSFTGSMAQTSTHLINVSKPFTVTLAL